MSVNDESMVFVSYSRTPFGSFGGGLKDLSSIDLFEQSSRAALKSSGLEAKDVDAVYVGNVVQSDVDSIYLARHAALRLGCRIETPCLAVNRLCGSGFEAIAQGALALMTEDYSTVLVGGSESMSRVPFVVREARWGSKMGNLVFEDFLLASLTDQYVGLPMAITAENLATQYSLTRTQCDEWALESQRRAARAWAEGRFASEVAPIVAGSAKKPITIDRDQHVRADASAEGLAKLKPVFKEQGVVTAGNASGMVDGAASLLMCTESFAKGRGLKILGRLKGWASTGCDPKIMGIGPVPATQKLLQKTSLKIEDFKRIEINEAFAPQFLSVARELKLDLQKCNVNGGAIAIGHPLGASGTRLVGHLLLELARAGGGLGLASACIGGGQGMSVAVEVA
jgi:acetyl-CoA acyltransferase 2